MYCSYIPIEGRLLSLTDIVGTINREVDRSFEMVGYRAKKSYLGIGTPAAAMRSATSTSMNATKIGLLIAYSWFLRLGQTYDRWPSAFVTRKNSDSLQNI